MIITVQTALRCKTTSEIDIPIDTWDEIKEWYIKWDKLHYTTKNGKSGEIDLESDLMDTDTIDWKWPLSSIILDSKNNILDEEGRITYEHG